MTQTTEIELTEEQQEAVTIAIDVLTMDLEQKHLTIGGWAGVGKSYLIRHIVAQVPNVAVVAFTGRAVHVLRGKGVPNAQTLHSLIYKMKVDSAGEIVMENGCPVFLKRDFIECDGVLVDEAAMLSSSLYKDLISYGLPVVFVGDHGQLEPVGDDPKLMVNPDIRLEKIHRQAEASPIIRFAHALREGKRFDWSTADPEQLRVLHSRRHAEAMAHKFDVVICARNKTRHTFNKLIREAKKLREPIDEGERLICLRNDRNAGVFNGMMFTVTEVLDWYNDLAFVVMKNDDGVEFHGVWVQFCKDPSAVAQVRRDRIAVDYGYAITCHKFQGGQADSVLVIEEEMGKLWDSKRWSYSAASRAVKKLVWCGPR